MLLFSRSVFSGRHVFSSRLLAFLSLVAFTFSSSLFSASVSADGVLIPKPPTLSAKGYLLIDADSGKVLVEHNADERLEPASLTKIMTSYILAKELSEGRVSEDDEVLVSENAWAKKFQGSSLMFIEVGTRVKLSELHKGVVISSGNDATVAVAEHLAGSEDAFADIMNQQAEIIGMTNSHFVNSHGLPHEDHYTTASDMAKLAIRLINDYPEHYKLHSQKEFTYNNIVQTNRNRLLWQDKYVDGLKTGYTSKAGYCLVASAKRDGMRLISVVMGTDSERARVRENQKLLSYGFRYFETHKLYSAGEPIQEDGLKVWGGAGDSVGLTVEEDVYVTIPKGTRKNLKATMKAEDAWAPIDVGGELGMLSVELDGEPVVEHKLVAMQAVEDGGFFKRIWHKILIYLLQFWPF